jgi:ureidoglycolate lyase
MFGPKIVTHRLPDGGSRFANSPCSGDNMTALEIELLTREGFAPFGDVIETDGSPHFAINAGFAERFHDLASVDVAAGGGQPLISIFRGQPRPPPLRLTLMERHPLGSQAFFPLQDHSWLVVVAAGTDPCRPDGLRAFRAGGRQGVNYARGTWHHPLIVLTPDHDFLVIDRGGEGANLEEVPFPDTSDIVLNGSVSS